MRIQRKLNMNLISLLLPLLVLITVKAAPYHPETPASTYLVDYSVPAPVGYGYNPNEFRSIQAISSTLTDKIQAVAGWQLTKMRKKWIKVICFFTPKPKKTSDKPKPKKCKKTINLPFPGRRDNPPQFDFPLGSDSDWEADEEYPDIFVPVLAFRDDSAYPYVIPERSAFIVPETNSPAVFNTDVAEQKSAAILTAAANFQMSQWIWRWNIILCLVNPSCPHVNIPATKLESRRDYPPSQVDMEMFRALNQYINYLYYW